LNRQRGGGDADPQDIEERNQGCDSVQLPSSRFCIFPFRRGA